MQKWLSDWQIVEGRMVLWIDEGQTFVIEPGSLRRTSTWTSRHWASPIERGNRS